MMLRSYVTGSWISPSAEGDPLLDAVTELKTVKPELYAEAEVFFG